MRGLLVGDNVTFTGGGEGRLDQKRVGRSVVVVVSGGSRVRVVSLSSMETKYRSKVFREKHPRLIKRGEEGSLQ